MKYYKYSVFLIGGPLEGFKTFTDSAKLTTMDRAFSFYNGRLKKYHFYKYSHRIGNKFYMTFTGLTKPDKYWRK